MSNFKVGYLIGSLSSTSINRKLALALTKLAPPQLHMFEISFRDLSSYSPDFDADYPAVARKFKDAIKSADAILFVSPEYNRSIPGALKNAIDWAAALTGRMRSRASPRLSLARPRAQSALLSVSKVCAPCSASVTRRK